MTPLLLDTVTVSELRRAEHRMQPGVRAWQRGVGESFISVITLIELRYGIRKVEPRDPVFAAQLMAWYAQIIARPQTFRILNVDRAVAELAADFRAAHDTPFEDSLIAATAKVHGLTLATRNTADFQACGISLVNPWDFAP
jgi:predicted nucleic acid-binding protein